MKLAVLVSVLAFGCGTPDPDGEPAIQQRVRHYDFPEAQPWETDVLIVVDASAAMAPYRDRLPAFAHTFAARIDPYADLHVAVVSADPTLPPALGRVIVDTGFSYDRRETSFFTGSLGDAVAAAVSATGGTAAPEPFAVARRVLEAHPDFDRGESLVVVPIVAADDPSATAGDDVAALASSAEQFRVSAIYPVGSAPTLDGLAGTLGFAFAASPIAGSTDAPFADLEHLVVESLLGPGCMPKTDRECAFVRVATDVNGEVQRAVLPPCPQLDGVRCWSRVETSGCDAATENTPVIVGDVGRRRGLEIECVEPTAGAD